MTHRSKNLSRWALAAGLGLVLATSAVARAGDLDQPLMLAMLSNRSTAQTADQVWSSLSPLQDQSVYLPKELSVPSVEPGPLAASNEQQLAPAIEPEQMAAAAMAAFDAPAPDQHQGMTLAGCSLVGAAMLLVCTRNRLFRLIDGAMFRAVAAVQRPGARIRWQGDRPRRSRSASRRRGEDVQWYFRTARGNGSHSGRRRSRQRECVVADQVFAAAPARGPAASGLRRASLGETSLRLLPAPTC